MMQTFLRSLFGQEIKTIGIGVPFSQSIIPVNSGFYQSGLLR
jgi:hypothetical protein